MKHKEYILLPFPYKVSHNTFVSKYYMSLYHNSMKSYEYMMSYRKDRGTGLLHEGSVSPCLWRSVNNYFILGKNLYRSEGENITDLIPKIYKP